jgi:uncharacterized protein with PIN domain
MNQAQFRFYAELNDFLPRGRKFVSFAHAFKGHPSIKDTIEALGVPHTEVDLILVNGESVDFSYLVQDGDRVSVYPVFEAFDITPVLRVRPKPLRVTRFVLDVHLGKLAGYLRMLGFDSLYSNEDWGDAELARVSRDDRRILLTRDRGLVKRGIVTHGYCVRDTNPRQQLLEVVRRFDLIRSFEPFKRCIRCNGLLESVPKEHIRHRLSSKTLQYYNEFRICQECDQIYWKGSHHRQMEALVEYVGAHIPSGDV